MNVSFCFSGPVTWIIYHEVFPSCHCDYSVHGLAHDLRREQTKLQKMWVTAHLLWTILCDVPLLKWLDVSYAITCWETIYKKQMSCLVFQQNISYHRKLHILRNFNQLSLLVVWLVEQILIFFPEFISRTKKADL